MSEGRGVRSFEGDLVVLHRNVFIGYPSLAVLVVGVLGLARYALADAASGFGGALAVIYGAVGSVSTLGMYGFPVPRRARVRATSEGVFVGERLVLPRAEVADGRLVPDADGLRLELVDRGQRPRFLARVASEEEGRAVLHGLDLDAAARRTTLLASPVLVAHPILFVPILALAMVLIGNVKRHQPDPDWLLALGIVFLPVLVALLLPSYLEVGTDGIAIRTLRRTRFVSYGDVRAIEPRGDAKVRLLLASGKRETLSISAGERERAIVRGKRDLALVTIRTAWRAFHAEPKDRRIATLLARTARPRDAWLDALRHLRGEAGYRDLAVSDEDLWRILEDPTAAADVRTGAAIVLRAAASKDDGARARIRVSAESTVAPRLRAALDAIVGDANDDTVVDALEEEGAPDERDRAQS